MNLYPWGAFGSFMDAVTIFENKPVFDANLLKLTKSYADHIVSNFRFFDFANESNEPTPLFKEFISKEDKRPMLKDLLRKKYSEIFGKVVQPSDLTEELLQTLFEGYTNSSFTRRKMIAFFKNAAKYAEIPISAPIKSRNNKTAHYVLNSHSSFHQHNQQTQQLQQTQTTQQSNNDLDKVPPIILNLVKDLPAQGKEWNPEKREQWLKMLQSAVLYYYPEPKA